MFALFAAAMRWGGIVHFISETVLTGFKIGAGIVIAVSTLPLLLGLAGSHGDLWRTLAHIARNLGGMHVPSLVLGVVAFARAAGRTRAAAALADPAHRRRARARADGAARRRSR